MRFLTGNTLGNGNAFVAGFVCQHRAADHVADCPYVRQVGTAFAIYFDEAAFVFFQAYGFGVQPLVFGIRPMATISLSNTSVLASPAAVS